MEVLIVVLCVADLSYLLAKDTILQGGLRVRDVLDLRHSLDFAHYIVEAGVARPINIFLIARKNKNISDIRHVTDFVDIPRLTSVQCPSNRPTCNWRLDSGLHCDGKPSRTRMYLNIIFQNKIERETTSCAQLLDS